MFVLIRPILLDLFRKFRIWCQGSQAFVFPAPLLFTTGGDTLEKPECPSIISNFL